VRNLQRVMNVTSALSEAQRAAIHRCVELMCYGMPRFQSTASRNGLPRLTDLDDYCYYVAGVVGDMLTSCFANTRRSLPAAGRAAKPVRVVRARAANDQHLEGRVGGPQPWRLLAAPGDFLASRRGPGAVDVHTADPGFAAGMRELIGVAHAHLRNALEYTLLIPANEAGIRRFACGPSGLRC